MITAVSMGLVQACVDQPLTVVETPPATGGTASAVAELGGANGHEGGSDEHAVGGKGSNDATGGRTTTATKEWGTGGSNSALQCPNVGEPCDPNWVWCWGGGLVCESYRCKKENGFSCDSENDCRTSSSCKNGICTADEYFTCLRIGKRCDKPSHCCSGKCELAADNENRCQEIEGCKPVMEYSQYAWACCSSALLDTTLSGAYCVYSRSETGAETCKLPGETCGGSAWDDTKRCCDGLECRAGPELVARCTAKPSQSAKCNTSRDCAKIGTAEAPSEPRCIKYGSPSEAADGSPGASYGTCEVCVEEGGMCQVDYDCCEGLECNNDVCTKAAP